MESEHSIQMQEASQATESGPVRYTPKRREERKEGKNAPCEELAADKKRKQDRPCEEGLIRTPSPEYADAVQDVTAMGGTEEKGETRKVSTHVCSGSRETLARDYSCEC